MTENFKILTVNPGSTSTKVACFEDLRCISSMTLRHSPEDLSRFGSVIAQYGFRMQAVSDSITQQGIQMDQLNAVVGRGGLLRPVKGGTYTISKPMVDDLVSMKYGEHASNVGALIAHELAQRTNIPAFIVNPIVVDEMQPIARFSGLAGIQRRSVFHALNHKAVAMRASASLGKKYEDTNLIVAHIGGGISVAAHRNGSVIDVNNALEEGAFSPERTGSLPVLQLVDLCFSGIAKSEIRKMLVGRGGMISYTGTSDNMKINDRIADGNVEAENAQNAMAYQIAKEIGAYCTVLSGKVDAIVLTGGLAHSHMIIRFISDMVQFIAPILIFPGEDEMLAMAEGAYRILSGQENAIDYTA